MKNFKLFKDFGVRALLATMGAIGFYSLLIIVLFRFQLDVSNIVTIITLAQAPWMMAIAFYFGTKSNGGAP